MSYILDALKKDEAQQDPAAAANLALNQQRIQTRQRLTAILVVAALLANAAVLLWIFGPTVIAPTPVSTSEQRDSDDPPLAAQGQPQPQPKPPVAPPQQAPPVEVAAQPPAAPAEPIRIRLAELPPAARSRFPGLAFSTHIYADDPSLRAVVANRIRLVEGDEIEGTTVKRITQTGVILAFENYLVEVPVVAEWE